MIRVFPRQTKWTPTDELAFVGGPPLFKPPQQKIMVSVTFTWDIPEGVRLVKAWSDYYQDVQMGGPALGDPGGEFEPRCFIKEGVTITSRGCIFSCPWCFVPTREGSIRELATIQEGWIVQDNNLLACSRNHVEKVFQMLRHQRRAAVFSGGLDARLLQPWHRELIDSIRFHELWFACDTTSMMEPLKRATKILKGIPQRKKRCYVMIGYNGETISEATARLEWVYELGFDPFCQLYRGENLINCGSDWKALNRKWSRPAAYHTAT